MPIPYLASPAWHVSVVDDRGRPVQGVIVRLSYQDYSAERRSHEEDRTTNERGQASFERRESSASILQLYFFTQGYPPLGPGCMLASGGTRGFSPLVKVSKEARPLASL
jgi:hypothetical protein